MSTNDIIYGTVKKQEIYIPDWAKIPIYFNVVSPGILSGITNVGFNGSAMPGIHFSIPEKCDEDILLREILITIKYCMNHTPVALSISYQSVGFPTNQNKKPALQFSNCYDMSGRKKLLDANCNTIEDNTWGGLCIFGQRFFDRSHVAHSMVDLNGDIHPELLLLTKPFP